MSDIWKTLSVIDCSEHVENKGGFSYLSWTWAWSTLKQHYPDAEFHKHCNEDGYPCFTDDKGNAFVKVTVRIGEREMTELLYVMDNRNQSIQNPNSQQVNKALQRCLVKAIAYFGLGFYIYAGEDLPEGAPAKPVTVHGVGKDADVECSGDNQVDTVMTAFLTFIPECSDVETLRTFWSDNGEAISFLKEKNEKAYNTVLEAFTSHKESIGE
jgi:hypothetical protein